MTLYPLTSIMPCGCVMNLKSAKEYEVVPVCIGHKSRTPYYLLLDIMFRLTRQQQPVSTTGFTGIEVTFISVVLSVLAAITTYLVVTMSYMTP